MENNQNNLFTAFQQKKKQVCLLAEAALKAGWLDKTSYNEIISKINEDILTIGVIGQMKCGKSTFLNSFLFGEQLLPAATTPMTAALSVITYGDKKSIEAEFYSVNEWEELKTLAMRDVKECNDSQTLSSIKAAKELYEKSFAISSELPNLLGTKKCDDLKNLVEYVGADGKYVSIVKSVRITLPEEWLKGVEIVDTPGFNDPVVSREERTKEFLKRADVVLMMLYAGRAFDSTDRDILFDKVRKVGVGKIILAVNKYDIQIVQGESPDQIKGFITDELKKAVRQSNDESVYELLKDVEPILISAQMALLAKMPMSEINRDADLKYHFNDACNNFEVSTQSQLLKLSRISDLEDKVRDIISNQKEKILIDKPVNLIFQKARNTLDNYKMQLVELRQRKSNLEMPDEELETKIANLQKIQRRIERKIENAESDLSDEYDEISTKVFRDIQDKVDEVRNECERIIEQYKKDALIRKLTARIERLREREIPRLLKDSGTKIKKSLSNNLNQLSEDIESVIEKYIDDSDELVEQFRRTLMKGLDVDFSGRIRNGNIDNENNVSEDDVASLGDILIGVFAMPVVLPFVGIASLFDSRRDEARKISDDFFSSIDWDNIKCEFNSRKSKFMKTLNGDAARSIIEHLKTQAEEVLANKVQKEDELAAVKEKISSIEGNEKRLNEEVEKLKVIISNL